MKAPIRAPFTLMATDKQIEANRLNAKKSTGPRSVAGKAVSSMNALKSGVDAKSDVIRGEDPAALQALTDAYIERYQPATVEERQHVDVMIRADAQIWNYHLDSIYKLN